jgi:acetyl-CoA acetyltransferase
MKKLDREIWIVGAKRTAFGTLSGTLKGVSALDLAAHAARAAIEQSGVKATDFDHSILGNVQQTSPDAIYGARHVGLKAGLPIETPALTVNRLCGSGFQAVVTAAEQILLGDAKAVLATGSENMSQAPHAVWGLRDGAARFGKPPAMVDTLWEALTDSYCGCPMAITAENLAEKYGISREDADAFALRSQQRWAAALVVVDGAWGREQGLTPLAKLRQWGVAGVDPKIMGIGPAPAIRSALERAGLKQDDVDLFDVNEAFAPQFLAVQKELGLPEDRTNVNGGAIALGHPLGATGARITTNLVYTARKMGKSISVGSACIGGGQGIAIVLERA